MVYTTFQTRLIYNDVPVNSSSTKTLSWISPCPCTILYSEAQNLTTFPRVPNLRIPPPKNSGTPSSPSTMHLLVEKGEGGIYKSCLRVLKCKLYIRSPHPKNKSILLGSKNVTKRGFLILRGPHFQTFFDKSKNMWGKAFQFTHRPHPKQKDTWHGS
jgi:hypothetical protein